MPPPPRRLAAPFRAGPLHVPPGDVRVQAVQKGRGVRAQADAQAGGAPASADRAQRGSGQAREVRKHIRRAVVKRTETGKRRERLSGGQ